MSRPAYILQVAFQSRMSLSRSSYPYCAVASLDGRYVPSRSRIRKRPASTSLLAINYFNSLSGRVEMDPAWVEQIPLSQTRFGRVPNSVDRPVYIFSYTELSLSKHKQATSQKYPSVNFTTRPPTSCCLLVQNVVVSFFVSKWRVCQPGWCRYVQPPRRIRKRLPPNQERGLRPEQWLSLAVKWEGVVDCMPVMMCWLLSDFWPLMLIYIYVVVSNYK